MLKTPRRWTAEEDKTLLAAVSNLGGKNDVKDWTTIAKALPGRTNKDCRKRWTNHLVGGLKKGPWDTDEDDRLRCAIEEYGDQWTLVAEEVGGRSADQCAKRWHHSLNPTLDQSKWTQDEEQLLLEAVRKHGRAWKQIQKQYFSDRASNNVKNRYVTLTRRRGSLVNDETSRTCQSDAAPDVDDEMEGLEQPTGSDPSSPDPSRTTTPSGQGYTAMLDEDGHQYLTDISQTSLLGDVSKLIQGEAPQSRLGCPPFSFDNTNLSTLLDFVPDSYFGASSGSVSSSLDTPLTISSNGQFDHLNPARLYEGFSDQAMHSDDMLPAMSTMQLPQSTVFKLTLDDPNPETMVGVMSYLAHSKIKFKMEIN